MEVEAWKPRIGQLRALGRKGKGMTPRTKKGRFTKAPKPKFSVGQIVTTSPKHYSQHDVIMMNMVSWTESRGWVYGQSYCHVEKGKIIKQGGSCFWSNEDLFLEITDPATMLMAEVYYREKELHEMSLRKKRLENELLSLNFTLGIVRKGTQTTS